MCENKHCRSMYKKKKVKVKKKYHLLIDIRKGYIFACKR